MLNNHAGVQRQFLEAYKHVLRLMPKGGSLMEQDILKLPRKTPALSQKLIPAFSII